VGTLSAVTPSLAGKRAAMVMFSFYPDDPRPRRAAEALVREGMKVDLICLAAKGAPRRESLGLIDVVRVPLKKQRQGKLGYLYQYCAFILMSSTILALRSLSRRYDLVYVHNMPDILVLSALIPKMLGAKVILDQHDPMPELMTTIFGAEKASRSVRLMKRIERWSIARTDALITVNRACKRIFAARSCRPEKITVVMNSPDDEIFPLRAPQSPDSSRQSPNGRFVIMYHGSLVERNGLDLAVEALGRIRAAIPGVELRIYGSASLFLERVMEVVRSKGLEQAVHYLGPRRLEDLVRAIETCDIGVIPNHRNEFTAINTPTRIFEYLALGKPVIAPRTPGIQDYFDEQSLLFFEPGDPDDLGKTIEYAFNHPAELTEFAKRGQKIYEEHAWPKERAELMGVVSTLLGTEITQAKRVNQQDCAEQKVSCLTSRR
jgi:glycosyltransferase involved in cell wall biosynthesis